MTKIKFKLQKEEMTLADKAANARNDPTNQLSWLEALAAVAHKLNEFELDFVKSNLAYVRAGKSLTERQAETLEKIYAKRT